MAANLNKLGKFEEASENANKSIYLNSIYANPCRHKGFALEMMWNVSLAVQ